MRHDVPTEESQETAALYALGALSQHEARAFEVHLRQGCEICQQELNGFTGVVDALSAGSPAIPPPHYLRDLLNARIEKEVSLTIPTAPDAAQVYHFPDKATPTVPPVAQRSSLGTWLPWAAAAGLLIVFAYTLFSWRLEHRQLQAVAGQSTEARQQLAELREQLSDEKARARELEEINTVLAAPQRTVIAMTGLEAAPSASGSVYWDHQKSRWVVTANLPPVPAGKVYQLWVVTPDAKISAGLIEPDTRGHGFAIVDVPANVSQIQAAAITLEPQGGSPQPTMPIYALGKATS
ncbi:MAG TPA: anti-sigma factor [Blastocatellia bacterium]|nr:anti-sigma factor [Blastocatellia bacterium]